jgi:choline kinase
MKLFLLAAGRGKRLMPMTADTPKFLISVAEDVTLLEKVLSEVRGSGVFTQAVIVAGYKVGKIEAAVEDAAGGLPVRVVYNPFYDISSPLVSLYFAHFSGMAQEDFMVCNGDTFYRAALFARMASMADGITLAVEPDPRRDPDGVRVEMDREAIIQRVGKNLPLESARGVSLGIVSVKGDENRQAFVHALQHMMRVPANVETGTIWHSIFNTLCEMGVVVHTVQASAHEWFEIDHEQDLIRFKALIAAADGTIAAEP